MNWAEITSQEELLSWVPEDYRLYSNKKGYYRLTGFELSGNCWWCGADLNGKQRKWCTRNTVGELRGHWYIYYRHFCWSYARNWCIQRQDGHCANCDKHYGYSLEVHHIIPLKGNEREWTPFNLPWNLIGFCHGCHLEIHAAMRPEKLPSDPWEALMLKGQIPLFGELVR